MNLKLLFIPFLIMTHFAFAQNEEKKFSNTEAFLNSTGVILEKEFVEIGKVQTKSLNKNKLLTIQVLNITDLSTDKKTSALRFQYYYISQVSTDEKVAIIDPDEINDLINFFRMVDKNYLNTKPKNYTEVTYYSRGGFKTGCYFSTEKQEWELFMQLEKYDSMSKIYFKAESISNIYGLLLLVKTQIP